MARIFISHASKDDDAVLAVSDWLNAQGFDDHFVDHIDIPGGVSWDRELPRQLSRAEIVLLYMTRDWLASAECLAEYRAAYYGNKVIIPLLISESLRDLPPKGQQALQRILSSVQGISITAFPPDDVVASLLRGSLILSANTIKWSKRKRTIRRVSLAAASLAVILVGLSVYFRDYLDAYVETRRISGAFSGMSAAEFGERFADVESLPLTERRFRECSDSAYCPDMIVLPAGRFRMGASDDFDPDPSEMPNHVIDVPRLAVSIHEITQAQWQSCFVSTQLREEGRCKQAVAWQDNAHYPVDSVSWADARIYVDWLNRQVTGTSEGPYRLLSEAEWEYAARGLTSPDELHTIYFWGDNYRDACDHANALNASMQTIEIDRPGLDCAGNPELASPVGSFKPNRFGLFDMAGNLAEWVEDCWHDSHDGRPDDARAWTLSAEQNCERVIRGGSWAGDINNLRVAARVKLRDDLFGFNIGFRVARDLE